MTERDGYPAGVPCWVDNNQDDPATAAAFYGELFGWRTENSMPPEASGSYFMASLDGRQVAAITSQSDAGRAAAWNTYIAVEDADATAARVREAGGTVLADPFDVFTAGRMARFLDPAGAEFFVWQAGEHRGAQMVNAPNTWNWSNLETIDIEGAKAFYGEVFGWRAIDLGPGGPTMLILPGYGDFLEGIEPGIRKRQADSGVPAGFENAIGWLAETGDAPRWSVFFAVDDVDATARRAADLGGEVTVEPFDVPNARIATLVDPGGAPFTISAYRPS